MQSQQSSFPSTCGGGKGCWGGAAFAHAETHAGAVPHLPAVVLSVEGALLLALFARLRRPVPLLRVGAALALVADEGGDDVAILTRLGLQPARATDTDVTFIPLSADRKQTDSPARAF